MCIFPIVSLLICTFENCGCVNFFTFVIVQQIGWMPANIVNIFYEWMLEAKTFFILMMIFQRFIFLDVKSTFTTENGLKLVNHLLWYLKYSTSYWVMPRIRYSIIIIDLSIGQFQQNYPPTIESCTYSFTLCLLIYVNCDYFLSFFNDNFGRNFW